MASCDVSPKTWSYSMTTSKDCIVLTPMNTLNMKYIKINPQTNFKIQNIKGKDQTASKINKTQTRALE